MKRSKRKLFYLLAFLIPIIIVLTHIISMEIMHGDYFKNGENFLLADMASQYNSIYAYIWDVLRGNESIFYSFGKGLGGNMASTVGYYASSPLNVLYLFCPKVNIPFMTFIIYLIKIGLTSLFAYIFLQNKLKKDSHLLIFSITYSLMAYNVNYYFNNMWLDVILMTPLVLLGIDKIINEKSIWFYTVMLGLAIIFNFYIAYMLCIFCVIYFLYQLFIEYKLKEFNKYKYIFLRFVIASMLAGGIAAFWLLPSVLNLQEVMRFSLDKSLLNINYGDWFSDLFNKILCKFYLGSHNTTSVLSRNRPNLYSGLLTLVLCFFYFFNKNIKLKEKILSLIVILFFMSSFLIPHLNLFWQAGSFPNGYICRYSFLFSFFIIYLSARCFVKMDKIKIRYFIIFIILYGLISFKISKQYLVFLELDDIIISSVFIFLYLIILFFIMYLKRDDYKKQLKVILVLVVIVELFVNFKLCILTNSEMKIVGNYGNYYNQTCPVLNKLDDDFYRVDGDYRYSYLDSWICHNNTITTSLSTNTGDLYRFWKENGGNVTYTTIFYDLNKLPIFDSLFGVRYIMSEKKLEQTNYDYYDKFNVTKFKYSINGFEDKTVYLYKNPYALSLGYAISNNHQSLYKESKADNSFESLNRLMKTLTGNDDKVLKPYEKKYVGKNTYEFKINNEEPYLYLSFNYDVSINWSIYDSIYINEEYVASTTSEDIGNLKIDNKYPNQTITLRVGISEKQEEADDLVAYYLDMDVFKKDIEKLKQHQLENIKIDKNQMTGKISVDENSTLFTSIPYEKGWQVYVDGKRVSYEKVADEFIGIKLKKGKHTIKMKYYPHHLGMGIIISLCSLSLLVLYEKFIKRDRKK